MDIKTIKLKLMNPSILDVGRQVVNKYFDYIDVENCVNQGMINCYADEPYINLLDNLDPIITESKMYYILKIQNRELYKQLSSDTKLVLPKVTLSDYCNEGGRELRIVIEDCNQYNILSNYHHNLKKCLNNYIDEVPYKFNSYVTLTYLKPNTPDNVIQNIITEFSDQIFPYMEIQGFWLTSITNEKKLISIN